MNVINIKTKERVYEFLTNDALVPREIYPTNFSENEFFQNIVDDIVLDVTTVFEEAKKETYTPLAHVFKVSEDELSNRLVYLGISALESPTSLDDLIRESVEQQFSYYLDRVLRNIKEASNYEACINSYENKVPVYIFGVHVRERIQVAPIPVDYPVELETELPVVIENLKPAKFRSGKKIFYYYRENIKNVIDVTFIKDGLEQAKEKLLVHAAYIRMNLFIAIPGIHFTFYGLTEKGKAEVAQLKEYFSDLKTKKENIDKHFRSRYEINMTVKVAYKNKS